MEVFEKLLSGFKDLQTDISRIIIKKEKENKDIKNGKSGSNSEHQLSTKSFVSLTRMRNSEEELIEDQKQPDIAFIKDAIKKITEGV